MVISTEINSSNGSNSTSYSADLLNCTSTVASTRTVTTAVTATAVTATAVTATAAASTATATATAAASTHARRNSLRELSKTATVVSGNAKYTDDCIVALYPYTYVNVVHCQQQQQQLQQQQKQLQVYCNSTSNGKELDSFHADEAAVANVIKTEIHTRQLTFYTKRVVPRVGVMLVGMGGNNGSTFIAGLLANKRRLKWRSKQGFKQANWFGSLFLSSTTKLGVNRSSGYPVTVPLSSLLPLVNPDQLVVGGWDINSCNLGEAMKQAGVLDVDLQDQLYEHMAQCVPLPGIYRSDDFIASNQKERANHVIKGSSQEQLDQVREDIRNFKAVNRLEKVVVLWTATTERFSRVIAGVNDSESNLLKSIKENSSEISPSTLYAVAAILESCSYINGSPQNTCVPAVAELAINRQVFICGDDFKTGQTKLKSVLVDFLVSAGLRPASIVSYNHLGNNDGKNLSAPLQFRSKEITKSTVVDDMIESNPILYPNGNSPDHSVSICYVPFVGDSKRAMDEYTSEIFMGGVNTMIIHNTCEDSLLAAPVMLDLILLTELCERIAIDDHISDEESKNIMQSRNQKMHSILSITAYMCKAPLHPPSTPVVNSLFHQRYAIVNLMRACVGLPPENFLDLEHRLPSFMAEYRGGGGGGGTTTTNSSSSSR